MKQPGDKVTFSDGYSFYVTVHGPFVLTSCVDCDKEIPVRGRLDDIEPVRPPPSLSARCTGCCRRFHGLE